MADADPVLLELATLVRGALVLADEQRLHGIAAALDTALLMLVDLDGTGAIQPVPFDLGEDETSVVPLVRAS